MGELPNSITVLGLYEILIEGR